MVHVEVFLGDGTPGGEQSIGSRACDGHVAFHESFKFESQRYTNIRYHYRSLETWLDGVCRSWCEKHSWQVMKFSVTRGNNHEMISKFFSKEMVELLSQSEHTMRLVRVRWTQRHNESDFEQFVEGKHVLNHIRNSDELTNKISLNKNLACID